MNILRTSMPRKLLNQTNLRAGNGGVPPWGRARYSDEAPANPATLHLIVARSHKLQIAVHWCVFCSKSAYSGSYPDWDCLEVYFSWQRFEYKKANPLRMPCGALSARCRPKTLSRKSNVTLFI